MNDMYRSARRYETAVTGMQNELMMWSVASDLLLKEACRKRLGRLSGLDLCCGPGSFANKLAAKYLALDIVGVDLNQEFVRFATDTYGGRGWRFICQDVSSLDIPERFDVVMASSAYHHIPDQDKLHFLSVANDYLDEDGMVLVCENFLPNAYERREDNVRMYYRELIRAYTFQGMGTRKAVIAIRQARRQELAGENEHKVTLKQFQEAVSASGLFVETCIPVWNPVPDEEWGSYVFVLRKVS